MSDSSEFLNFLQETHVKEYCNNNTRKKIERVEYRGLNTCSSIIK